jgi:phosphate starvation-inducible PhoH-like protein
MSKKRDRANKFKKAQLTEKVSQNETKVDTTPVIYQNSKLKSPVAVFNRNFTPNQKRFIEMATSKDVSMMIVSGPAGTAKTYLAVYVSLLLMNEKKLSDIVYIRSAVESSDAKMGFLPGEKNDKMSPYMQPLMDKLDELLPAGDIKRLESEKRVDALPVGYLRGLSWNAKAIIGDEMQNCTKKELITLMTRAGEFSKLFLIGDPDQSDINGKSGFRDVFNLFNDGESQQNGIYTFEFTEEDIVRSKLVRFITKKVKNLR